MRRSLLLPLVPVYAAGLWAKRRFIEERSGYARRLAWPVVSIGSLSAGGAGKTPVVAALAELLGRLGFAVDVLSRGYGRSSATVKRVDAAGTAEQFGDEPLAMARAGLTVYVGADRYTAGRLAEVGELARSQGIHLLDDGFQHRRLARALDVVLLTAEDTEDWLLPAGNLREPLRRLRKADIVVLRENETEALRPVVRRLGGEMPIWVVQRRLVLAPVLGPVVAFCGIARPDGFFAMLRARGVEVAETVVFSDHYRYGQRDAEHLRSVAKGRMLVTTEKDEVRLSQAMRNRLGKFAVASLRVDFLHEEGVMEAIAQRLTG